VKDPLSFQLLRCALVNCSIGASRAGSIVRLGAGVADRLCLHKVDWRALGRVLSHLNPGWSMAGWALTSLVIVLLTLRWQIFLRQQNIVVPFITVFPHVGGSVL
jgi:uncharacterized membrane protein YbhN (UPF0104 family)